MHQLIHQDVDMAKILLAIGWKQETQFAFLIYKGFIPYWQMALLENKMNCFAEDATT